ncbi:phosphatase PAP2 family protein [Cellulomonas marina]|uniref:Undecaprenyl-diphosphatase n=1 Tax=Cellulomonas marina TaxID=988821 RepID=A0A1I0ZH49_9CELL|nr:phosphatase PAP2 family protein [Cellulomonas marina]GIG28555.1 hypothetical protein Cma02nite_11550 [Cellulomonas marina]SFB24692.1 undecaprenyl-diphosphatase [Cellulomonas marina]
MSRAAVLAHRWDDASRPPVAAVLRDLVVRAAAPAVLLWAVVTGVGWVVMGPLGGIPAEQDLAERFAEGRTAALDTVSAVLSGSASTLAITALALVTVLAVAVRTRRLSFALVPAVAVALELGVFLTSAVLVDRDRPDVEQLDHAPPTSSYPSGHTGAAAACWVVLALLAQRVRHRVLRGLLTAACLLVPVLVAWARLYRGMHHLTDVVAGLAVGATSALLAWGYLRRAGAAGTRRQTRA